MRIGLVGGVDDCTRVQQSQNTWWSLCCASSTAQNCEQVWSSTVGLHKASAQGICRSLWKRCACSYQMYSQMECSHFSCPGVETTWNQAKWWKPLGPFSRKQELMGLSTTPCIEKVLCPVAMISTKTSPALWQSSWHIEKTQLKNIRRCLKRASHRWRHRRSCTE